jgi:hypothetical protein
VSSDADELCIAHPTPAERDDWAKRSLRQACAEATKWRSAFAAEAEAHDDTRNLLDGVTRRRDASSVEVDRLTAEIGRALRRLVRAHGLLKDHGLVLDEPKHTTGDWYGCAVCSQKTDIPPALTRFHECCGRTAFVGPCCQVPLDHISEDLTSIMGGAGHARGCRG